MTPCEEKGYKVGDVFVVIEDHWNAKKGEKLTLLDDDGTNLPYFEKHTKGGDERYFPHLNWVEKVTTGGEIITRTNGQPFATESSARQQLTAKGLKDTHEVVSHEGGYALAPINRDDDPITLKPGDYVSTDGMTEEQYHAVARAFENAGCVRFDPSAGRGTGRFLEWWGCELVSTSSLDDGGRLLTIPQVLNATNAGTTPQPEETTMPANPITTLKQARQARDEAERTYQEALEEAREYLGQGFCLLEQVNAEAPQVDGEDMTDPANWREGDVVECVKTPKEVGSGFDDADFKIGGLYKVQIQDGSDSFAYSGDGIDGEYFEENECFRFHHRPK